MPLGMSGGRGGGSAKFQVQVDGVFRKKGRSQKWRGSARQLVGGGLRGARCGGAISGGQSKVAVESSRHTKPKSGGGPSSVELRQKLEERARPCPSARMWSSNARRLARPSEGAAGPPGGTSRAKASHRVWFPSPGARHTPSEPDMPNGVFRTTPSFSHHRTVEQYISSLSLPSEVGGGVTAGGGTWQPPPPIPRLRPFGRHARRAGRLEAGWGTATAAQAHGRFDAHASLRATLGVRVRVELRHATEPHRSRLRPSPPPAAPATPQGAARRGGRTAPQ